MNNQYSIASNRLNLSANETYYQEKRSFFLEGRDTSNLSVNGDQLFYSRRIGASPRYSTIFAANESGTSWYKWGS